MANHEIPGNNEGPDWHPIPEIAQNTTQETQASADPSLEHAERKNQIEFIDGEIERLEKEILTLKKHRDEVVKDDLTSQGIDVGALERLADRDQKEFEAAQAAVNKNTQAEIEI